LESSRQGAHDRMTPTAVSGVSLAVSLTVSLAVSGVSYFPSSSRVSGVSYGSRPYLSEFSSPEVERGPVGKLLSRHTRSCNNLRFHEI
jgi:hypothetical protein